MKIDLSIYQSILHSDLRPWLDSNKDDNRFRVKLSSNFKNPPQTLLDFDNAINKALIDFKSTLNEEEYLFEFPDDQVQFNGVVDEILYPLIEIKAQVPTNNKAIFYFYLIRNEATRLINNLYKFSLLNISESEKKNIFIGAIKGINALIQRKEQQKKQISKNSTYCQDPNNYFILDYLELTLIRLHLEVKELFEKYVTGNVYDEAGIYSNIIKKEQPLESHIKDTVGLNHFKVTSYINQTKHKKETTLEWILYCLETYSKYFQTETTNKEDAKRKKILLEDIQALENLYFLQLYKFKFENITYANLLDAELLDPIFNEAFLNSTEAIETHDLPNKRLNTVNKELQKLNFLNYDIEIDNLPYVQSIPRQLHDALSATKLFINANLSIDFSKITEPKAPPIKTNLSVGDLALLFRMLYELKPDIFDVKTKAELFRFISSNFTTKKSKEGDISIDTITKKFNDPETKSKELWATHLHTLLTFLKKV
ncbi:MAG: hypothetical protein KDD49_04920 [Bacteroidetes bacterium]|nr:hypothetical protein [Bacteroidota bacterium]